MRKFARSLILGASLLVLGGCQASGLPSLTPRTSAAPPTGSPSPVPAPLGTRLPSKVAPPPQPPHVSATPPVTPSPTIEIDPTYLSFLTVTPTATPNPFNASIRIYAPGPMSKVVTPIDLRALVEGRLAGPAQVELLGEDGRLLYRKTLRTYSFEGQDSRLALEVPFEVDAAGELGRLQISSSDSGGRVTAVSSLHLLLLSAGANQITPTGELRESVELEVPRSNAEVAGGQLNLRGRMKPFNGQPVIVELLDRKGQSLGSRLVALGPADGQYQPFETNVPYQVEARTPALLVIKQSDDRIAGPYYQFSLPVFLNP